MLLTKGGKLLLESGDLIRESQLLPLPFVDQGCLFISKMVDMALSLCHLGLEFDALNVM